MTVDVLRTWFFRVKRVPLFCRTPEASDAQKFLLRSGPFEFFPSSIESGDHSRLFVENFSRLWEEVFKPEAGMSLSLCGS